MLTWLVKYQIDQCIANGNIRICSQAFHVAVCRELETEP